MIGGSLEITLTPYSPFKRIPIYDDFYLIKIVELFVSGGEVRPGVR